MSKKKDEKLNILVIAHYQDDNSPYVSFVQSQVEEYVKLGHQVTVFAPVVLGKKYRCLESRKSVVINNVEVHYINYISLSNIGKYTVNNWSGYYHCLRHLKKMAKNKNFDIIHAHTIGFDGYIAVRLKRKFRIPSVITTHGSDTIKEIELGKGKWISDICSKADSVIAVSNKLKRILLEQNSALKIETILNGYILKNANTSSKTPRTIIQVSHLIEQKKADVTIKAFRKVLDAFHDAKLIIIGDGKERHNLERLCNELGIENNVHFLGMVNNSVVLEQMSKAEVFIMPSVNEGLGIVYLEAMSQRCLTIGSMGEGISDFIQNGENGYLIDPDNVDGIIECLLKCFRNQEVSKQIAERGYDSVQGMSWNANAQKTISLYQKIIRSNI